jgi:uncharacterized protein YdeI (YjbR/CyaY-like superfamily)
MTTKKSDLPIIPFASREAWETWPEELHTTSDGLWLKIARKGSSIDTVSYAEALEVALCYGWIDGQKASFDDHHWLQRFTPRRGRSKWSKINRQKATELIEKGEMKPAGLKEVERAKADGRWDAAYDAQSTATVPEDLLRELEKNDKAREFFAKLDSRTGTRSCTRSRMPRSRRRGCGAYRSAWPCWPRRRSYIPEVSAGRIVEAYPEHPVSGPSAVMCAVALAWHYASRRAAVSPRTWRNRLIHRST